MKIELENEEIVIRLTRQMTEQTMVHLIEYLQVLEITEKNKIRTEDEDTCSRLIDHQWLERSGVLS